MSDLGSWIHVQAAGMDLLLSTLELREVVEASPVSPLPGRPKGIQGVVVYQGEFLPVLAWEDLPGCQGPQAPPMALAVLRPRLALPIERMIGAMDPPPGFRREVDETDPTHGWVSGIWEVESQLFRLVDSDRLIALLQRFRGHR